jgi:2-phospho-L-lactate guanylyltransferase
MTAVYALVPIKPFGRAKVRLAGVATPAQRSALAQAMARRALQAACAAQSVERVFALCGDREGCELARRCGATPLRERGHISLSRRLMEAIDTLGAAGAGAAFYLAADLPDVSASDLDWLIAHHRGGVTLVAAERDGGTNALLCDLPRPIGFAFGPASAARHLARARRAGVAARRLQRSTLARDLDTAADLDRFANERRWSV